MLEKGSSRCLCGVFVALWVLISAPFAAPLRPVLRIDHEALCTYKQVTWDDFRGPSRRGQGVAWLTSAVVFEPYEIEVTRAEDGGYLARVRDPSVYAVMDKTRSGYQKGARSDQTLAHEQLHFDVAEYHARRFAAEVGDIVATASEDSPELYRSLHDRVDAAFQALLSAMEEHQARYDDETRHGTRKRDQRRWSERIADLLASTPAYEIR